MTRVSFVGLGHVHAAHAGAVRACESFAPVAICDRNPLTLRSSPFRDTAQYTSVEDMLAGDGSDLVVVAVPLRAHVRIARAALEAGRHVLLEKPAAPTVRDLESLYQCADRNRRRLVVALHARFGSEVRWLVGTYLPAHAPRLGPLTRIECLFADSLIANAPPGRLETLCGSWIDSGINALSVVAQLVPDMQIDAARFTDSSEWPGVHDVRATVDIQFPVESSETPGTGTIQTDWTLGHDEKTTRLRYERTGKTLTLEHSRQRVLETAEGGSSRLLADCRSQETRLHQHYAGVYRDLESHLANGTDNRTLAIKIHRVWENGRTGARAGGG